MPLVLDPAPLRPAPQAPPAPRVSGQAIRFLVVGGVATVVDVGLFNLLHLGLGAGPLTAKVASTLVAGVVAFLGNREFSFGHQKDRCVRRQAVSFALVSAAALLLNLLVIAVARYGLDLRGAVAVNVAANGVGLALATAFRFVGCRRWVFPPVEAPAGAPLAEQGVRERLAA